VHTPAILALVESGADVDTIAARLGALEVDIIGTPDVE